MSIVYYSMYGKMALQAYRQRPAAPLPLVCADRDARDDCRPGHRGPRQIPSTGTEASIQAAVLTTFDEFSFSFYL